MVGFYHYGHREDEAIKYKAMATLMNRVALRSLAMHLEFDSIARDESQVMEIRLHHHKRADRCFKNYLTAKAIEVRNL